jgi:hypothetical protein
VAIAGGVVQMPLIVVLDSPYWLVEENAVDECVEEHLGEQTRREAHAGTYDHADSRFQQ